VSGAPAVLPANSTVVQAASAECRQDFGRQELHRPGDLLQRHVRNLVLCQEHVVANALLLSGQPADHCFRAADESQAIIVLRELLSGVVPSRLGIGRYRVELEWTRVARSIMGAAVVEKFRRRSPRERVATSAPQQAYLPAWL
jgi:hypothetical protein